MVARKAAAVTGPMLGTVRRRWRRGSWVARCSWRAPIGGPFGRPQTAPDFPALSTDHRHLPEWEEFRSDGLCLPLVLDRHFVPSWQGRVGNFQFPQVGIIEFPMTPGDTQRRGPITKAGRARWLL